VAIGATSRSFPSAVRELLRRLGLPATLQEAGVERAALADMAAEVDPVRLSNNPRALTVAELVAVLDEAWPT
jgi:alcohol dehydrogenase class IV